MKLRHVASAIVLSLALGGGTVEAGSQPSVGIVRYNPQEQINEARAALRLAKTTLNDAIAKSRSLVAKAERTVDPKAKIKLLQEAADLLTTATKLRKQIDALEASLEQLGIAKEVYQNQLALEKKAAEQAAQERLAAQQTTVLEAAEAAETLSATTQMDAGPLEVEAGPIIDVVRKVAASFGSDVLKSLASNAINMTAMHSADFGWIVFDDDVAAFKTELFTQFRLDNPDAIAEGVEQFGVDAIVDVAATMIARGVLEEVYGDTIDVDLVMAIAPTVAGLIKTGVEAQVAIESGKATLATAVSPGSVIVSAVLTSIKVGKVARSSAMSSYEEDDNFRTVAASVDTIATLGTLSARGSLDSPGKASLTALRNNTISDAATAIRTIYQGNDGPIVEDMYRTSIKARELLDKGDTDGAQELVDHMKSISTYADPLDVTNNFYENFFMVGRRPDAERAYAILIEQADLGALAR